ncbi:hypothetical protein SUNI508_00679 [Seiridium unicorne]|uniref:Uncharacterized protein n=1 Tax=Seiridium unicorne TaxID=138068 RepID=A0ABR2V8I3_9PEZI
MNDPRMSRMNEKSIIGAWKSKERSLLEMNVEMTSIFTRALEALEMYVDQCSNIHRPVPCLGLLMVVILEVYRTFTSNEKGTPQELPWGDTSGFGELVDVQALKLLLAHINKSPNAITTPTQLLYAIVSNGRRISDETPLRLHEASPGTHEDHTLGPRSHDTPLEPLHSTKFKGLDYWVYPVPNALAQDRETMDMLCMVTEAVSLVSVESVYDGNGCVICIKPCLTDERYSGCPLLRSGLRRVERLRRWRAWEFIEFSINRYNSSGKMPYLPTIMHEFLQLKET